MALSDAGVVTIRGQSANDQNMHKTVTLSDPQIAGRRFEALVARYWDFAADRERPARTRTGSPPYPSTEGATRCTFTWGRSRRISDIREPWMS
jgi:hypothetical protein